LFTVPYLVPSDVSFQVFNILLHASVMGRKYATSSGCVSWVDVGGRH
jgi:hypothetical protein